MKSPFALPLACLALSLSAACDTRECRYYNECGADAFCSADGVCLPASPLPRAVPRVDGVPNARRQGPDAETFQDTASLEGEFGPAGALDVDATLLGTREGARLGLQVLGYDNGWGSFLWLDVPDAAALPLPGDPPLTIYVDDEQAPVTTLLCSDGPGGERYDAPADVTVIFALPSANADVDPGVVYRVTATYGGGADEDWFDSEPSHAEAHFVLR